MKRLFATFVLIAVTEAAYCFELNEVSIKAVNNEIDLVQLLFSKTNNLVRNRFETQLCGGFQPDNLKTLVSFKQVSFVFYYQNTNECMDSYAELASPDALLYSGGQVIHINDKNKSPFSYVRVVDLQITNTIAEVTVLICVSPLGGKTKIVPSYHHRTFRFLHVNGKDWELISHLTGTRTSLTLPRIGGEDETK